MHAVAHVTRPQYPALAIVFRGVNASGNRSSTEGLLRLYDRGDEIFAEGDDADCFYKIVSGSVRSYKLLSDGRRQIDALHLPGDFFGLEAAAEHRFTADAVQQTTVRAFRRSCLARLTAEDPAFGEQLLVSMMRNLERAQAHMLLLGRKTAQEKTGQLPIRNGRSPDPGRWSCRPPHAASRHRRPSRADHRNNLPHAYAIGARALHRPAIGQPRRRSLQHQGPSSPSRMTGKVAEVDRASAIGWTEVFWAPAENAKTISISPSCVTC